MCAAVAAGAMALSSAPLAAPRSCPDPIFTVRADDAALVARTCTAAEAARKSLASCGVILDRPIEIEVMDVLDEAMVDCLGLYRCGADLVMVLTPAALSETRDRDGSFAPLSDAALWDSVIVHELTHAAYDGTACPFETCAVTAEYAGYAMQIRALPPSERALIARSLPPGEALADPISAATLFLSPDWFSQAVWRDFQTRDDPCGFMRSIMAGEVFFERGAPSRTDPDPPCLPGRCPISAIPGEK